MAGSGYYEDLPSVAFTSPNGAGATGATGTVITNGSQIQQIVITSGGTNYQPVVTTATIATSTGSGAILEVIVGPSGSIYAINVTDSGIGYLITDTITIVRALPYNAGYITATASIGALGVRWYCICSRHH